MEIPENLHCLISATVQEENGAYVIEIPEQEIEQGALTPGDTYRIGIFEAHSDADSSGDQDASEPETTDEPPSPPVELGERRTVDIEGMGDQGDGIARVERGFVIIVPETDKGERVTIRVTDVRENVAFAEVVERRDYNR